MLVLERSSRDRFVAIFGLGLIGNSCRQALDRRGSWTARELPFTWTAIDAKATAEEDHGIVHALGSVFERSPFNARLDFLWTAGRCGFEANDRDIEPELGSFERTVRIAERLRETNRKIQIRFMMTSSAGGLFEGQKLVSPRSRPEPLRPYGILKLRQEERLRSAASGIQKLILRPSSVYGRVARGGRQSLISVLIRNGLRREVSNIVGSLGTQRDYVYVDDIARYVASRVLEETSVTNESECVNLVSGRGTTIQEICHAVEGALGRRLLVQFDRHAANKNDITFAASAAAPSPWHPSELGGAIRHLTRLSLSSNSREL